MKTQTKRAKMNELALLLTLVIGAVDVLILYFGKQFFTFLKSSM